MTVQLSTIKAGCLLFLVVFFAATAAFAQVAPTGTISGVVKDPTGLVLPHAKVTVVNVAQNVPRTTVTGEDGSYRIPALPVGRYDVKVQLAGFQTKTETGTTLDVDQEAVVNVTLSVGSVEQQVVVSADTTRVDTTTSSIGHVVDNHQINELPLNGRNFIDLTLLQTGITQFQGNNFGTNALFGTFFSANGAPIRSNMYTLDGAIMGNIQGASASSVSGLSLGLDGISEYRIMTNSFSAEYGLVMGSQTTIVTKAGTNQFHGDAFEYIRNSVFDARNYFDLLYTLPSSVPGGGRRIAPFKRNQFGGALGGPIQKDKTFFFGTYEGFREVYNNPPNVGVTPTIPAACHAPIVGGVETVTSACDSSLAAGATENVAPAIQPILALWPLPNVEPGDQFTYLSTERTHEDYVQGRVDHTFGSRDSMFGRYTFDNTNETYPKLFPLYDFGLIERQQYLTLAENHTFTPTLLNSVRFSFSRSRILDATPSPGNSAAQALKGPKYSCITGQLICGFNISSVANFADASVASVNNVQQVYSFGEDVFLTKGKHGLKFGALINHYNQYANEGQGQKGATSFSTLHNFLLGKYRNYTVYAPGNNALKDMLFQTIGFYGQDDYHVTQRLTLNLGLRYEFTTQPREKNHRESHFDNPPFSDAPTAGPIVGNPTFHDISPRLGFAYDVFGNGKTSLKGGFAILYDLANTGAVFGLEGLAMPPYSVSYVITPCPSGTSPSPTNSCGPSTLQLPLYMPAAATSGSLAGTSPTSIDYHYKSPRMLDYNLALERELPFRTVLSAAYVGSRGTHLWQTPYEDNPNCPISNSYVPTGCASITTGVSALPVWTNNSKDPNNHAPAVCGAAECRRNPFFSNFALFEANGISWYNALEVNLTKSLSHGLQFQVAYTYSKLLDDTEGIANSDTSGSTTDTIEDPFNALVDYGPANFDVKHNLHINALYHLPRFGATGFMDKIINGWWTGSIINFHTGMPFSPTLSSDRELAGLTGTNGGLERPSHVTAANIGAVTAAAQAAGVTTCPVGATQCYPYNPVIYDKKKVITHNVNQWFNPNMFTLQPVGTIGDVRRNDLTEPGLVTWDVSLSKDTAVRRLGEGGNVEFRAEAFNVLNHANFGAAQNGGFLAGSTGDQAEQPSFTGIIATSTPGRQVQFSLRLQF